MGVRLTGNEFKGSGVSNFSEDYGIKVKAKDLIPLTVNPTCREVLSD